MLQLQARGGMRVEDRDARVRWRDLQFELDRVGRCPYCHVQLTPEVTQIDHIVPLSRGGDDSPENWQLVCGVCNMGKSDSIEGRYSLNWGSSDLFRRLVLQGKLTVSPWERFELLSRARYACALCEQPTRPGSRLSLFFVQTPSEGGQAIPENLTVMCARHGDPADEVPTQEVKSPWS